MKLLLDQNLSFRLCAALADLYPGTTQARLLGLDTADDLTLWKHAAAEGYTLVTQDADFRDLAALYGAPPKVVLLRCGNKPTAFIERLLRDQVVRMHALEVARGRPAGDRLNALHPGCGLQYKEVARRP